MSVTIKDIAKKTGFSVATVSRVLSNKTGFFSQTTAQAIHQAAADLGYKKNMAATELVMQTSNVIAVIINSTKTNFSDQIIMGIQKKAGETGKRVIILYAGDHDQTAQQIALTTALERPLLGILLVSVDLYPDNLQLLKSAKVPFFFISISFEDTKLNYIASDDYQIGYQATKFLIKHGHRKIGLAGVDISPSAHTGNLRFHGYRKALAESGINFQTNWLQTGDYSYEAGVAAMNAYQKGKVSAIVAASDLVGIGILNQAAKIGLHIPADLSVVSIDGTNLCQLVRPALTSITQDFYQMGYLGTTYLISGSNKNAYTEIQICQRASVKKN
ncbi:LacI family DNA-binding transcriptional regulator [Liquorilactobacillus nagelii]|uniref:LacI family DNA-binding transcriptional regulator n=1 Tax=Liquorilactobacillus nagelii TaxID=82688 RepID=UPI0006EEFF3A|nr:LacI family DNA-binding transcriptional regulator [Liquorilactobacillus nagelii]KRL42412.1 transcriptional regulator [Liquorilactobacillus nagelii DSM 13675]QYH53264.1 LacI family transcriptional regulator [Liquorilactobacillus nagelii DSM 13675]